MTRVFLGLGANLGDRQGQMREALRMLPARCRIVAVSALYESEALVPEGAPPGPDFLNAASEIETALTAHELLALVKEIERAIGREPSARWAARPIDIDILLFGDEIIETAELTVPHPRMAERAFVLVPLAEIAAPVVHPTLARTIAQLAGETAGDLVRVSESDWGAWPRGPCEKEE